MLCCLDALWLAPSSLFLCYWVPYPLQCCVSMTGSVCLFLWMLLCRSFSFHFFFFSFFLCLLVSFLSCLILFFLLLLSAVCRWNERRSDTKGDTACTTTYTLIRGQEARNERRKTDDGSQEEREEQRKKSQQQRRACSVGGERVSERRMEASIGGGGLVHNGVRL